MVYDLFLFLDEFELLEVRLQELWDVVDRFVLVEADRTFKGGPKPLHFAENRGRFDPYAGKLTALAVTGLPGGEDPWPREHYQRESFKRLLGSWGLAPGGTVADDDTLLLGDADEIASASAVRRYRPDMGLLGLHMRWYHLYLNVRRRQDWYAAKVFSGREFHARTMYDVRYADCRAAGRLAPAGGWHFGYAGGYDRVEYKVRSFSHWNEPTAEPMLADYKAGRAFDRDGGKVYRVPVDDQLPACVRARAAALAEQGFILP